MYHRYLIEAGIEMRESATSTYHLINKSSTWSLTLLPMCLPKLHGRYRCSQINPPATVQPFEISLGIILLNGEWTESPRVPPIALFERLFGTKNHLIWIFNFERKLESFEILIGSINNSSLLANHKLVGIYCIPYRIDRLL